MSDHLPECQDALIPDWENQWWICICKYLRAYERVLRRELDATREAIAETHLPVPVVQCECGWYANCPECGPESIRIVGSVCRICCDDWGDHGYCDDMHNEDDTPVHHVGGDMWSGPFCPVIAAIDAVREKI